MFGFLKASRLLLISLLLFTLAIVVSNYIGPLAHKYSLKADVQQCQQSILDKEVVIDSLISENRNKPLKSILNNWKEIQEICRQNGLILFMRQSGALQLWTSKKTIPSDNLQLDGNFRLQKTGNGYYLQKSFQFSDRQWIFMLPVKTQYSIENQYLQNEFQLGNPKLNFFENPLEAYDAQLIRDENETVLFGLSVPEKVSANSLWPGLLYILSILFFIFHFYQRLILYHHQQSRNKNLLIYLVFISFYIFIWKLTPTLISLEQTDFFSPAIFANSIVFSSLGDLVFFGLLIAFSTRFLNKFKITPLSKGRFQGIWLSGFFLLSLFVNQLHLNLFDSLIINSNIPLDFSDYFSLNYLSFASLLVIFLILYSLVFLNYFLFCLIKNFYEDHNLLIVYGLIAIIIFSLIFLNTNYLFLPTLAFSSFLWIVYYLNRTAQPFFNLSFSVLIISICSGLAGYHLITFNEAKEKEYRKLIATKINDKRDAVTEYLFNDLSEEIKNDPYIQSYFLNPLFSKSYLERRLKALYFSGYLIKYQIEIHTFGRSGLSLKENYLLQLDYYRNKIKNFGQNTGSPNLYFMEESENRPAYLSLFEFSRFQKHIGSLVIELKQKTFYEESIYPELLLTENVSESNQYKDYSYAIYENGRLSAQKGSYPYPLIANPSSREKNFFFFNLEGFSHLYHRLSKNSFVVLSKENDGMIYPAAVFSSLFIFFFISILLLLIPGQISEIDFKRIKEQFNEQGFRIFNPFNNLLFRTKIEVVVFASVFIALGVIGFATISYLRINYTEKVKEELKEKVKLVNNRIETEIKNDPVIFYSNSEGLFSLLQSLSDNYRLDMHIFNTDGRLMSSSQNQIFEKGIMAGIMPPDAYFQLSRKFYSQLVKKEQTGNLEYLSFYVPVRSADNRVLAYLQVPYYAQESRLRNEISSLLVTLVNIYVFILLLVSFISVLFSNALTNPLALLKEKMSKIEFGKRNDPLEWDNKDELGDLVNSYNQMLKALEESADKLARSEREGAWREMARQIAHEIKNPLTPMKLNVQKMIRAWQNNTENKDEVIQKVSKVLIRQIDQLSFIATEFSSFAKMPVDKATQISVHDEIRQVIDLFLDERKTQIEFNPKAEKDHIFADQDQFSRIFNNLTKNALQAIPEDRFGQIEIETYNQHGRIHIIITDNGSGITADQQEKIFSPNFSTKSSGMGLGLAIVKKAVETARGDISFRSEAGKGTSFFLSFPLYE